jgi:hypothetical protein
MHLALKQLYYVTLIISNDKQLHYVTEIKARLTNLIWGNDNPWQGKISTYFPAHKMHRDFFFR